MNALPPTEVVITAERAPEEAADTAASVSIVDEQRIDRLAEPLVPALLRLTPSVAVATSGTAGSLTEVRIRGAENNHTLLFIDGIRVNDPATGNQPRYELLNADIADRLEVVRGPQSALWGSEAVGGVVALNGVDVAAAGFDVSSEAGSFGFRRTAASASLAGDTTDAALAVAWQRADGIDAFDGTGDRDGYRNLAGRFRGTWTASSNVRLGFAGVALAGRSEYDGFAGFLHADTLDSTRNRLLAGRGWLGFESGRWSAQLGASLLGSKNRNLLAEDEINRTSGRRATIDAQMQRSLRTGTVEHRIILAVDHEKEEFHARGLVSSLSTDQDRSRSHQALTLDWRAEVGRLATDVAIRRDRFNRFEDATTIRASLLADVGAGFSLAASYGEGIAQPTFFDLYGFFPGSFEGNQSLTPESSRGFEMSMRYNKGRFRASLAGYRQRLTDEIVDVFDFASGISSTANRSEKSRRSGLEAEVQWFAADHLRLTANYGYLNATEPNDSGVGEVREGRRPKHSGSVSADGSIGRVTYGLSVAYTGARIDTDFESFPFRPVRLDPYWLSGVRLGYGLSRGVELFARAANAFDARYQDAFGYRTEGRSVYAGIRLGRRP